MPSQSVETASHAGHCLINLVNIWYIETKQEQEKSYEISQNVR